MARRPRRERHLLGPLQFRRMVRRSGATTEERISRSLSSTPAAPTTHGRRDEHPAACFEKTNGATLPRLRLSLTIPGDRGTGCVRGRCPGRIGRGREGAGRGRARHRLHRFRFSGVDHRPARRTGTSRRERSDGTSHLGLGGNHLPQDDRGRTFGSTPKRADLALLGAQPSPTPPAARVDGSPHADWYIVTLTDTVTPESMSPTPMP